MIISTAYSVGKPLLKDVLVWWKVKGSLGVKR